jgi:hypothetical protein
MAEPVADGSLLSKAPGSKKKAPAKKAATKKAPAQKAAATRTQHGPQGWLQNEILSVCESFKSGDLDTGGKPLTPHRIAKIIGERGNPTPSSGAVAACLSRWQEYGFAKIADKPLSFKDFTAAAKKKGLSTMVEEHRKAAWAARRSA